MKETSDIGKVQTQIYLTDNTIRTINAPLRDVLQEYLKASPNDCNIERVKPSRD